ncbi:alkaline phosphatase-like protein [Cucurbitaria berberidis CBS 394.84]|uniref:Alkaline phosphatase-like protein n=1 Tax=Cucurbitaria berberidis CBS 394.84 TaxID=1168544 RepID=A0A9P4GGC0_9PLEO|nr:alkaline phosphatase-like protein [Cucurbitaria berberidis CBS 394.84]KAF1844951.1 alkaline phosphatase-like protein [Cucurbitaria berberidis CBS 394.84]
MQINYLAPLQAFLDPKNQFALFFVGSFVAKLLHLGSHATSLPIVLYLLYFPTFILPDVILLVGSKLLVYTQNARHASPYRKIFGGLLAGFTAACAAAQISFSIETGGEIQWMAASKLMGGSGGLGLLLSGLPAMAIAFAVLYAISLVVAPRFYDAVEHVLERISRSFRQSYQLIKKRKPSTDEDQQQLLVPLNEEPAPWPAARESTEIMDHTPPKQAPSTKTAIAVVFTTLFAAVVVIILQIVRPKNPPYAHMSGTLPITILEAAWFQPINSEFCLPHPVEMAVFPFERFNKFYNHAQSPDWMPQSELCNKANRPGPPPWMEHPEDGPPGPPPPGPPPPGPPPHGHPPGPPPPHGHPPGPPPPPGPPLGPPGPPPPGPPPDKRRDAGFQRPRNGHRKHYEPVCDPLKLSNLDAEIHQTLQETLDTKKPKIKNVLLLTLESTRKDIFPFKKDSHAYRTILSSYTSPNASAELDAKLASLTDTAAFLSGESTGFGAHDEKASKGSWRAAFKDGMGGINVHGAVTQAAYTLKSLLSSHCGVEPLPVDFTEEIRGRIYQACLPHVLETMSQLTRSEEEGTEDEDQKKTETARENKEKDHRSWEWSSTLVQSVIDQFDYQDVLDEHMGFKDVIAESTLSKPTSKHYPPKQPWSNYFGYPETETLDYLRDLFVDGQKQQKRVFVSHLTSTPHHPFKTPKGWEGKTEYMKKQRWRPEDPFDAYLNTIKWQDEWVSQIFQMLHDVGALDETLVVMTGDHGLAFATVDKAQSTVNNGHISNFAIPLLFVHPDLPRLQLNASTTPLSILPTVLDLLLQTKSLHNPAAEIARDVLPNYQGNSLIRNLDYRVPTTNGLSAPAFFQPFHFSAINPGGSLLAISDASTSYRLILPLCSTIALRFTDVSIDPTESEPIVAWTMDELIATVKVKHGARAKDWVQLAEELGRWWFWDQREKWGYWGNARSTSRGAGEVAGTGRIKKKHWWETK